MLLLRVKIEGETEVAASNPYAGGGAPGGGYVPPPAGAYNGHGAPPAQNPYAGGGLSWQRQRAPQPMPTTVWMARAGRAESPPRRTRARRLSDVPMHSPSYRPTSFPPPNAAP